MKRLFLSLTAAIAFCAGAMAQDSRVATLQHGTNFRTYYGTDAFISAHEDAADGDVITLTAGEFNLCNVSKAITVRGEGMRKTLLKKNDGYGARFNIPKDSPFSLSLEGLIIDGPGTYFESTGGFASVVMSKCVLRGDYSVNFSKCNAVCVNSQFDKRVVSQSNASITFINSKLLGRYDNVSLSGNTFVVNNCIIKYKFSIKNSIIKNSVICEVSTLDNTNTTSNCLLKEGSSGFANSWYVKTEPEVNPDPWGEDPETPVLWDELFGEDYHLTDAAAATYIGTDGTQIGIWGGAYPYDETPDYPLVKNLEVKGIHEDGKLQVKINVE